MCDDLNPMDVEDESATAREADQLHASPACKNPNCPNRHRCAAAAKLSEAKPAPPAVPLGTK